MLAEVALEADRPNARIGSVESFESRKRSVGGTVIDVDDLERTPELLERCDRAAVQLLERRDLVVERHDDGELGHRVRIRVNRGQRLGLGHACGIVPGSAER